MIQKDCLYDLLELHKTAKYSEIIVEIVLNVLEEYIT